MASNIAFISVDPKEKRKNDRLVKVHAAKAGRKKLQTDTKIRWHITRPAHGSVVTSIEEIDAKPPRSHVPRAPSADEQEVEKGVRRADEGLPEMRPTVLPISRGVVSGLENTRSDGLDGEFFRYLSTNVSPPALDPEEIRTRFTTISERRLLSYAVVHFGYNHLMVMQNRTDDASYSRMLFHRTEAVRLLKDAIEELGHLGPQMLLQAVFNLLLEANNPEAEYQDPLPFAPHRPGNYWVDILGRIVKSVDVHHQALVAIVRCARITPGMAWSVKSFDLAASSRASASPVFPYDPERDNCLLYARRLSPLPEGAKPGVGFVGQVPGRLPAEAIAVFTEISIIDQLLHRTRSRQLSDAQIKAARVSRESVQRRLLCLSPWDDLPDAEKNGCSRDPYDCCRLTSLLYSTAVVYPVPSHPGWHIKLVAQIRRLFDASQLLVDRMARAVVMWSLFVAGIAAHQTSHRTWFEYTLRSLLLRNLTQAWAEAKRLIGQFVWSDGATQQGALSLWEAPGTEQ